jgi:predicted nuclease of predicted toxin-antitoxin system
VTAEATRPAVKLLLDEHLSRKVAFRLQDQFPGSTQVAVVGLNHTPDSEVWEYAREHGYTLVSKDVDFHPILAKQGFPPKLIHLKVPNCDNTKMEMILRTNSLRIRTFALFGEQGLLTITHHG